MLETIFDLLFEHTGDRMGEKICPLDAFLRVDDKHFSEDLFDKGMGFAGESQGFIFYFFEEVDDIVGSVRDSE